MKRGNEEREGERGRERRKKEVDREGCEEKLL